MIVIKWKCQKCGIENTSIAKDKCGEMFVTCENKIGECGEEFGVKWETRIEIYTRLYELSEIISSSVTKNQKNQRI